MDEIDRKLPARHDPGDEVGIALLEVLVASIVVGFTAVAVALLFSLGNTWVMAGGDNRVAIGLAQQKVEQLRAMTFGCIPLGGPGPKAAVPPCTVTQNYNEGGSTWVTATGASAPAPSNRGFTRITCVQYVSDTNFNSPPYTGSTTGTPCLPGNPTSTKRIVVIVQPTRPTESEGPVIIEASITSAPGGI
ncbi:MAG TPA: hypothetical protein VEL75_03025 [Candidatus Methylomirabilis sp.]|nr:hypothetical protein [Candidatus Methylomirabilis sp.]